LRKLPHSFSNTVLNFETVTKLIKSINIRRRNKICVFIRYPIAVWYNTHISCMCVPII